MLTSTQEVTLFKFHMRNISIILLSIIFLPLSSIIVAIALILNQFPSFRPFRRKLEKDVPRVLVTGVGMSKGLFVARALYLGGCEVYGADFDKFGNLHCGRFSNALKKFLPLKNPLTSGLNVYISEVIKIINREQIDLWISCSGVATAIDDARLAREIIRQTKCKVFQFDENIVSELDDKLNFMKKTSELKLSNIQWYPVIALKDIQSVLTQIKRSSENGLPGKFIIKSASLDDLIRNTFPLLSSQDLKKAEKVLHSLDFSKGRKWILQEFIESNEEYCSQTIVINGIVRAFTACPSEPVLLHYKKLDSDSILYQQMLQFTQDYVAGLGKITGHISFDFLARYQASRDGIFKKLVPIECNPRCHTATILFNGNEVSLTDRYLEVLFGEEKTPILHTGSNTEHGFYWIGHDLVLLVASFLHLVIPGSMTPSWSTIIHQILEFLSHILTWKDPTFLWWDPLPWLVLNHFYWPCELALTGLNNRKWKQLNVSTGKIFPTL